MFVHFGILPGVAALKARKILESKRVVTSGALGTPELHNEDVKELYAGSHMHELYGEKSTHDQKPSELEGDRTFKPVELGINTPRP